MMQNNLIRIFSEVKFLTQRRKDAGVRNIFDCSI